MTIKASQQRTIWEFFSSEESAQIDARNRLGPYKVALGLDFGRHFDCSNYDACLAYSAKMNWSTFDCQGCRKAEHGRFIPCRERPIPTTAK
jgi:hypothetical protein